MSFISLFDITSVLVPDLTISLWIPASAAVTVNPVGIGTLEVFYFYFWEKISKLCTVLTTLFSNDKTKKFATFFKI